MPQSLLNDLYRHPRIGKMSPQAMFQDMGMDAERPLRNQTDPHVRPRSGGVEAASHKGEDEKFTNLHEWGWEPDCREPYTRSVEEPVQGRGRGRAKFIMASCCQCPPSHSALLVLRRAPSFARLCNRSETIRSSSVTPSEGWWRRGESNSRPKWSHRSFYVCIRSFNLVTAAADRQATSVTSVHVKFRSKARSHNFRTNLLLSPHSA